MNWEQIIPLLFAAMLGGLLGLERQVQGKPAGIRTHILICVGAATFTVVSRIMAGEGGDSATRIAAQVVTGIGFLGAGAIIIQGAGVKGLTTAASLWVVAGIGLAVGCGFYSASIVATVLTFAVLFFLRYIEGVILGKEKNEKGG